MNVPEAQEQHIVEFVFTEGSGYGDEEGLSEQRRAGVVVARLFVLLPQVHWDHYMVCIFHPVHRQLESVERSVVSSEVPLSMLLVSSHSEIMIPAYLCPWQIRRFQLVDSQLLCAINL